MAFSPNLPPQAYTRDTLVKAIEWMSTQPAAVREQANSADLIVSHFLAARRRMPFASELPSTDFRAIAESLKALEDPVAAEKPEPEPEPPPRVAPPAPPVTQSLAAPAPTPAPKSPRRRAVEPKTNEVGPARGQVENGGDEVTWTLDHRSRSIAREVQDRMNLSSESEALRMLVAMGAERLRAVLP